MGTIRRRRLLWMDQRPRASALTLGLGPPSGVSIGRLSGVGALWNCVSRVCGGGGGCAGGGVPLGAGPCCPDVGREVSLGGKHHHYRARPIMARVEDPASEPRVVQFQQFVFAPAQAAHLRQVVVGIRPSRRTNDGKWQCLRYHLLVNRGIAKKNLSHRPGTDAPPLNKPWLPA